ncbi:MAG: EF-Tu/IF-2/RF-3 family GTPase [Treponema sp.]|nr:EF-Tu/IF-2/RF-3 family GTPase [Treponema sp.]
MDYPKGRGVVKSPAGGETSQKVTDVFNVSFDPVSDWEFIRWKIVDSATKAEIPNGTYLRIFSVDESETKCEFLKEPTGEMQLCLEPVIAERPQILSNSPILTGGGTMKDTSIQVIFDNDMDPMSICYTSDEIDELIASGVSNTDFIPAIDETERMHYGYKRLNQQGVEEYIYKNVAISDNVNGTNLNNYFNPPVFEGTRLLSISTKKDMELPDFSQILVRLDRNFFCNVDGKDITMTSGKKWIYQVTDQADSVKPEILEPSKFKVELTNGMQLTPILQSVFPDRPHNSDYTPFNNDKMLKLNLKLKDDKSGPADYFTINLVRVSILTYVNGVYHWEEDTSPREKTLAVKFQSVNDGVAVFNDTVDLSSLSLEQGVYRISSFIFKDKCGNELVYKSPASDANYYFTIDKTFMVIGSSSDVFTIGGDTIITGKVKGGKINVNDSLQIIGNGKVFNVKVKGIEVFRKPVDYAYAGNNVGINIGTTVSKSDLTGDMLLCSMNDFKNNKIFKANIHIFTQEEGGKNCAISSGFRPGFYFYGDGDGTNLQEFVLSGCINALGTMTFVGSINPGSDATVEVQFVSTIPLTENQIFLIMEGGRRVGIGTVTLVVL